MNKEKAELYIQLFARAFLVTETAENLLREWRQPKNLEFEKIFSFSSKLLDDIEARAKFDLTEEEYNYYQEQTDHPHRYGRE